MKPPRVLDDDAPAPRRRRALSAEERALWEDVAKQVKPLRKARARKNSKTIALSIELSTHAAPPLPTGEGSTGRAKRSQSGEGERTSQITAPPHPDKGVHARLQRAMGERERTAVAERQKPNLLTRREKSKLSRGRQEIEARIDLHGMTQARAHRALLAFLQRASLDGMSFVLVITGKGRAVGPESERGILRRQVPLWLALPEFRAMVVGYDEAGIGHGGEGALYVRLRRGRS